MTDRGFTPGPWQTKNDYVPGCITIIANVDGEIIDGTTHHTYDFIATCEDEYGEASLDAVGNARLIAASPDILKALEKFIYEVTHLSPCNPDGSHHCTISAETLAFARTVRAKAVRTHALSLDAESGK